jgi:hypothetical protein
LKLTPYVVFGTEVTLVVGKLGDMYGKKRVLTYVLVAYSDTTRGRAIRGGNSR